MGLVLVLEHLDRPLRQRHHLGRGLDGQGLDAADVLVGSDHQVAVRVRVEVQDHEAPIATVDDQVLPIVLLAGLHAEDAPLLDVLRRLLHVGEAPGRPDAVVGHTA
jgi:hypothetical protein